MHLLRTLKLAFIAFLSFLYLPIIAQETVFVGRVLENESQTIVPFANVLVLNEQDSVISAALSDENGEFKLKLIPRQNLTLRLSGIGYKNTDYPFDISSSELGDLFIEKDIKMFEDVEVAAQNSVVQKFDRKIFSMNENKKAAAKDIYDLLRTLPGVVVDEQKNVRYKGALASILVDDMPAEYMYPDLEMIPVQMVDKIELIDASMQTGEIGKGGIINIRMKVQKEDGLSGVASLRGALEKEKINSGNTYLNLNLKSNKWVFFNNLYAMKGRWAQESIDDGVLHFEDVDYISETNSMYDYSYMYLMDYLGAQYDISENSKFVFAYGLTGNKSNNFSQSEMTQWVDGLIFRDYNRVSGGNSERFSSNAYMFYRHSFDTTLRELKVYTSLNLPSFVQNNVATGDYYYNQLNFLPTDSVLLTKTLEIGDEFEVFAGAFYNHPINEKSRWNANYRASLSNSLGRSTEYYINNILQLSELSKIDGFSFNQFLSTRFGTTLGKWKLDAGINQQHYHYDFEVVDYDEDLIDTTAFIKADFYDILPSTTIMFTIDSMQDLKLSYSRSARAPWYSQLNPILFKGNPHSWSQGNPNLKAVVHDNVYFGYSLNKAMWNFSAELFYSQTNNEVAYLQIPLSETLHLSMPDNYAFNSRLGMDLSGYYSIKGKYNFNLSGSFYHSELDSGDLSDALESSGIVAENVTKTNFGFDVKLSTDVSLAKNTSAMFFVSYNSREYRISGYDYASLNSSINVTQRFFERKLTVSVGVNNLFNEFLPMGSYYNYLNQEYTSDILYSSQQQRMLFLSLNYRFNQGDRNTGQVGQDM